MIIIVKKKGHPKMIGKRRSQDYGLRITGGHAKESFSRFPIVADELRCRRSRVIAYDTWPVSVGASKREIPGSCRYVIREG
jgi:hypothetical protein